MYAGRIRTVSLPAYMYFFPLFSILVCLAAQIHGFALSGRFRLNRRELFTLIVRLTFRHPFKNFLLICIFVFAVELAIYYPPLLFIIPAGSFWLSSFIQEPLFKKYINYEEDNDISAV